MALSWARYLRKVHVEWCPFTSTSSAAAWFDVVSARKVAEASPKLVVSKKLLANSEGADAPAQLTKLTFVDGSEQTLPLAGVHIKGILEEIDLTNGRLDTEAMKSGKPWK